MTAPSKMNYAHRSDNGNNGNNGNNGKSKNSHSGNGNGTSGNPIGNSVVLTPPTANDIKADFIIDTCRRSLTIGSAHFVFGLLSFILCLASLACLVYTLNHVSAELANLRNDIAKVHAEMYTVNKRHFMLAQDWCDRMNPKK